MQQNRTKGTHGRLYVILIQITHSGGVTNYETDINRHQIASTEMEKIK